MKDLTWSCEVCHEVRPDEKITVMTYPLKGFIGAERNLKYCNDNDSCYEQALIKAKEGGF